MSLASLAFRLRRVNEVPLVEMVRLTLWKRGVKGVAVTLLAKGVDGWITANFLAKRTNFLPISLKKIQGTGEICVLWRPDDPGKLVGLSLPC